MHSIQCFLFFAFFISLTLAGNPCNAQYAEKDFVRYTVREGLSENVVGCIEQDDQGYLWIGTDAGLNRFDGKIFKKVDQSAMPVKLANTAISRLKKFGKDKLGVIGKDGFHLLNTRNFSLQSFTIADSTAFRSQLNSAWDAVDLSGNAFAVTTAAGFYVFDKTGKLMLRHDAYHASDVGHKRILYGRYFFTLPHQQYLVYVEENRLALYNGKNGSYAEIDTLDTGWKFFRQSLERPDDYWLLKHQLGPEKFVFIPIYENVLVYYNHALKKKVVSPMPFIVADNISWQSRLVKVNDSVFVLNHRSNGFYVLKFNSKTGQFTCDGKLHLENSKVISLFTDKDKRLWIGTTDGLLKQSLYPSLIQAYKFSPTSGEKFTGGFSSTYVHNNILYAGRISHGRGMAVIDASTMQLKKELDFYGYQSKWNEVLSLEMYHPDTLWIGTGGGLLWYDTKSGRFGKLLDEKKYPWAVGFSAIMAPLRKDGYAWMCNLLEGKLVRYHVPTRTFTLFTSQTKPALPFDRLKRVLYDAYGDVWISGHSLARWNNRTQVFDTLINVYGGVNKYNDDIVTISSDDNGSLWLHNAHNGLLEYRIKEKQFLAYTTKDGLASDNLHSLSPVVNGKIWVASMNNLNLFDIRTKKFIVYGNDDGLPGQRPTGRRMFYDSSSGQVYLTCNEYIVRFPFFTGERPDHSSDLVIEEVAIDNNTIVYQPEKKLRIKYDQNNLVIHYSVIDFEQSNYQFAYRINGTGNWNTLGNQRSFSLTNLSPGNYSVQIRALGKPGIEKMTELVFLIRPPFWKTFWFISLLVILLATGIYVLYRTRIQSIRQRANLDKQLSQTEMKALQAQMNPHFIFNSLNSIREMILNNENKDASHYLSKFAHLIRITLVQSSQSLVSLSNTVDYLERYMEMEAIRNSGFTHEISLAENLDPDETFVPPMLIQPFIENAIWHGISATKKTIHVKIEFSRTANNLVCIIDDNGKGIREAEKNKSNSRSRHHSVGIANIKNRVNLLNEKYGLHANINIVDKKEIPGSTDSGTRVTLLLPLQIKDL